MSNLTRAGELSLRRTLETIARRIAARNPFRLDGKCEHCHAHEGQRKHNDGCLYVIAVETKELLDEVSR